jgi:hypothetical protein
MKMFNLKSELPETIDELNQYNRRNDAENEAFDTLLVILYATTLVLLMGFGCSILAEKLTKFETNIQRSLN